jgi:hypothetical protein
MVALTAASTDSMRYMTAAGAVLRAVRLMRLTSSAGGVISRAHAAACVATRPGRRAGCLDAILLQFRWTFGKLSWPEGRPPYGRLSAVDDARTTAGMRKAAPCRLG